MSFTNDLELRFVVLRHEPGRQFSRTSQPHFDWLFEVPEGSLRTFATGCLDDLTNAITMPAESLADHRREYLDYEGPISNDRGTVTRVIRGAYRLNLADVHHWDASIAWQDVNTGETHHMRSVFDFVATRGVWQLALSRER